MAAAFTSKFVVSAKASQKPVEELSQLYLSLTTRSSLAKPTKAAPNAILNPHRNSVVLATAFAATGKPPQAMKLLPSSRL
ncbi:hypothetical protein U1Q18_046184 [Sarracenia purpurea var. burkii]